MMEQVKPKTTPKDFFLHIGAIGALYVSTISLIALWFKIIDEHFADPLIYSDPYSGGISMAIASLVVIFPIYLVLLWVIRKSEAAHPEKAELGVRKWLIYFTLFLSGLIVVIDLITILNRFLSGREITAAFFAKVVVVFVVVGAIFGYYLTKARNVAISQKRARVLTAAVAGFVLLSIVCGFAVMGSPREQRMKRLDQERVYDLQDIEWQVSWYFRNTGALPASLDDLARTAPGYVAPSDPETGKPYEYRVKGERMFELCATFATSNKNISDAKRIAPRPYKTVFEHDKGRQCFERKVIEQKAPPVPVL